MDRFKCGFHVKLSVQDEPIGFVGYLGHCGLAQEQVLDEESTLSVAESGVNSQEGRINSLLALLVPIWS